jgi:hypothetical protein
LGGAEAVVKGMNGCASNGIVRKSGERNLKKNTHSLTQSQSYLLRVLYFIRLIGLFIQLADALLSCEQVWGRLWRWRRPTNGGYKMH